MGNSNTRAKQQLIEIYGEECFIEKLKLRPKPTKEKYKSQGQRKRMKQLTYHHIQKREDGGKETIENGAILSAENHEWFNQQPPQEQERLNRIFQQYKMGVLEVQNGRVVDAQGISFEERQELFSIPLEPLDKSKYDRAKIKRQTQQAINLYYEKGGR